MRHPEYINSWLQILKNDTKTIFIAAAKAQNAAAKAQNAAGFVLDKAGISDYHEAPLPAAA